MKRNHETDMKAAHKRARHVGRCVARVREFPGELGKLEHLRLRAEPAAFVLCILYCILLCVVCTVFGTVWCTPRESVDHTVYNVTVLYTVWSTLLWCITYAFCKAYAVLGDPQLLTPNLARAASMS